MCSTSQRVVTAGAVRRPRWGLLYSVTLPQLAALAVVEAAGPPTPVRIAARWMLAIGTFVAMAVWLRASRAAFDLQEWCDCAGRSVTVRVIDARSPRSAPEPIEQEVAHEGVERPRRDRATSIERRRARDVEVEAAAAGRDEVHRHG
jgi:hypothetical protein